MKNATYIISDLHLGSQFCRVNDFMNFLQSLPDMATLVLNGDTVTRWDRNLTQVHHNVLDTLRKESRKRKIIWIRGNHDSRYKLEDPSDIKFASSHNIDDTTLVIHGDNHDSIRSFFKPLIFGVYYFHRLGLKLGLSSNSPSQFAKNLAWLYRPYKELYINNVTRFARNRGYKTVICGHVHCPDDRTENDVRYLNTGSWVDDSTSYALANNGNIELHKLKRNR